MDHLDITHKEIDGFLNSIPQAERSPFNEDGDGSHRVDIFQTIRRQLESKLVLDLVMTNLLSPFALGAGMAFQGIFQHLFSNARQRSDAVTTRALSPLRKALEPVFDRLGITKINDERCLDSAPFYVLHLTALAVQSLALILQSYIGGSTALFSFKFLASSVSDFILEGASCHPNATKVYASSQRLSCLGAMLGKEVLVVGLRASSTKATGYRCNSSKACRYVGTS
ncbi:hypothetical protein BBP40_004970 [Aspergillus hancockii]|nr:hypothetical protein BBP40_004970 [Aspergillus hancockii]